jgi:membrane protease subunit (stomatin/prohibitin family)
VTLRDKDFGAVRFRAFGNFAWRVADPARFYLQVAGAREQLGLAAIDEPLRALLVQHLADAVAESGIAFLDLAANQVEFAARIQAAAAPAIDALGVELVSVTVQSVSLPDELQKLLDQRAGMTLVGADMGRFLQYQMGQSLPAMAAGSGTAGGAAGGGGAVGDAMGLGAGMAMGQLLAQQLQGGASAAAPAVATVRPDEVLATIEKLGELHAKGLLSAEEFGAKKTELLKKLS